MRGGRGRFGSGAWLMPDVWRDVSDLTGPLDFDRWFGRKAPVWMEIGCGKGQWLVRAAERHPDVNLVGVEKDGRYLKRGRIKVERAGIETIRLIHGDMTLFLMENVADNAVEAIHVYFPDPWPKRRHWKRRMFTEAGVQQFARVLAPAARLWVKTDVPVNYTRIRYAVDRSGLFHRETIAEWPAGQGPGDNIETNFETKYAAIGKRVFHARWRKRDL